MITKILTLEDGTKIEKEIIPTKIEMDIVENLVTITYMESFKDKVLGGAIEKRVSYSTDRNPQASLAVKAEAESALSEFIDGTLLVIES